MMAFSGTSPPSASRIAKVAPVIFSNLSASSRTAFDSASVASGCRTMTQFALPPLAMLNSDRADRLSPRKITQAKPTHPDRATLSCCSKRSFTPHSLAFPRQSATQNIVPPTCLCAYCGINCIYEPA